MATRAFFERDWVTFTGSASVAITIALAVFVTANVFEPLQSRIIVAIFGAAVGVAFFSAWVGATLDGRLPGVVSSAKRDDHISGWSVLLVLASLSVIAGLAAWASQFAGEAALSARISQVIFWAVLSALLITAFAPLPDIQSTPRWAMPIALLGSAASYIDLVLVHAFARSTAIETRSNWLRYGISAGMILACCGLAYSLEPPWGFVPIVWVLLFVVSIFRRWATVEIDRETALRQGQFSGSNMVVGFGRNLRSYVLLSCVGLLLLLPLALRQAYIWSLDLHAPIFEMGDADPDDFTAWVELVGGELAKALPVVDWAEVYEVHAGGRLTMATGSIASHHLIFMTRVIVDFLILGTLLRVSTASAVERAQRRLLFEGALNRLDPFIEAAEFRKLVRRGTAGEWVATQDLLAFPTYDGERLKELAAHPDERISAAAKLLIRRDTVE